MISFGLYQSGYLVAFSLTLPFLVYQVWEFVRPALRANEARAVFAYIPATSLFCSGTGFGFYFVTPAILQVLLSLGEGLFETRLTAQNYLSSSFIPLFRLPAFLSCRFCVLSDFYRFAQSEIFGKYRRYAYFILLVLAVVLTPADFISDLSMTVPLILLYEVSTLLSRIIYQRKSTRKLMGLLKDIGVPGVIIIILGALLISDQTPA